jgi:hypothetical protein
MSSAGRAAVLKRRPKGSITYIELGKGTPELQKNESKHCNLERDHCIEVRDGDGDECSRTVCVRKEKFAHPMWHLRSWSMRSGYTQ